MIVIPIRAIPNQRLSFSNGQDRWEIEIKAAIVSMICNVWLNDDPVVLGSRLVAGTPFIPYGRLSESGNFAILTDRTDEPNYRLFGVSQQLVFWQ